MLRDEENSIRSSDVTMKFAELFKSLTQNEKSPCSSANLALVKLPSLKDWPNELFQVTYRDAEEQASCRIDLGFHAGRR